MIRGAHGGEDGLQKLVAGFIGRGETVVEVEDDRVRHGLMAAPASR
jgi:hypothetical protein